MRVRLTALGSIALVVLLAVPAAAQVGQVQCRYVHGVPGLVADMYTNGELQVDDFQPGSISQVFNPEPGALSLDVKPFEGPGDAAPLLSFPVELAAGSNVSIAVHLNEAGEPIATRFTNSTADLAAGQGRLTVRHAAAAPAVDLLVDGSAQLTNVANGAEASSSIAADTFEISVALAGTTEPVLGPVQVQVAAGSQTAVYPVGSAEDGTLDLLVQTIEGQAQTPTGVGAGSGGQAAPALPLWFVTGVAVAAAIGAAAIVRLTLITRR